MVYGYPALTLLPCRRTSERLTFLLSCPESHFCYGMADMTGGESMGHQYPFVPYSSGLAIWSRSCCGIGLTRHFS